MRSGDKISLSVRQLVESVMRSGSLDSRFSGMSRAVEGTRLHQKLQKLRKEEAAASGLAYQKERSVQCEVLEGGVSLSVGGRIDGILEGGQFPVVEEIKTTGAALERIGEDFNRLHWAQAVCYGYLYAREKGAGSVDIKLTYLNVDSGEAKSFIRSMGFEETEAFFLELIRGFASWARRALERQALRDGSIRAFSFPYAHYRKGQRQFAVAVYKTIQEGRKLFIQAPTGTGKTISALFPSVKALGEGLAVKIFYLTAKTTTRQAAVDALRHMEQKGLVLKTVALTAKEKLCFKEKTDCNPDYCEYARGYYDRVNAAVLEILEAESIMDRELLLEYASGYGLCPFELSLDLALWADCIVCDYNYVFDPRVYLKRFFMEKDDYVFLVDEAHNLADRAREMHSAELFKRDFLDIKRSKDLKGHRLAAAAARINSLFIKQRKAAGGENRRIGAEELKEFCGLLEEFTASAEERLSAGARDETYWKVLELYFNASAFLRVYEGFDESYCAYIQPERSDARLKLLCLDPSGLLREALERGKAAVFFSATLSPGRYFRDILGGSGEDYSMKLPSPFHKEHLGVFMADSVSTRYRSREESYGTLARYIYAAVSSKPGNYLVFFPSYRYMQRVFDLFREAYPGIAVMIQSAGMDEADREEFLAGFKNGEGEAVTGFAVMGGVFSEGIDLLGDRLLGAVIVGVGLPQVCFERELLSGYYKANNGMGFEYAYMYPGMNKVLQAAGRVIRSEEDRGILLLLDERFAYGSYRGLLPAEWLPYTRVNEGNINECIRGFWDNAIIE